MPTWLYLYFLLAGCLFLVVLVGIAFNYHIADLQSESIKLNREWTQRDECYGQLGRLAASVSLPDMDVIQSSQRAKVLERLQRAALAFDDAAADARSELSANGPSEDARPLLLGLDDECRAVTKMAADSNEVFDSFGRGRSESNQRIAAMDEQSKKVDEAVLAVDQILNDIEQSTFDKQVQQLATLTRWQYGSDGLITLLAIGVVAYAVIISRQTAEAARNSERQRVILEESEEALRRETATAAQANLAKSTFLANMSHEIRTPITSIMGYTELLLEPSHNELEQREALQVIRRSTRHLLDLVNQILDISKIEAHKMKVERILTDVPQIVADVASFMRPSAMAKGLSLELTFGDLVPWRILSDPIRVKQVLINLVGNAVKFTTRGEIRLHVSCMVQNGRCIPIFEVSDTGIGMTEDQMQQVFQAFTQADDSTTRRFGGTGLGLTISKRLAELLGGELSVKSLATVGSDFRFTIDGGPVDKVEMVRGFSESMLKRTLDEPDVGRTTLSGRILLAEDGLDNQRLIANHLRNAGAEVVVAENGRIAVDLANSQNFDLIFMDMQMPEMDGYEATRELRRAGHELPIVALTANAMAEDRAKCLSCGCTDYLTKPIEKRLLLSAAATHLDRSRAASHTEASSPATDFPPCSIRSAFADDPDMIEVIEDFVASLPTKLAQIQLQFSNRDVTELRRTIHQLKGAGGGFGFDGISSLAAVMERSLKDDASIEKIQVDMESLLAHLQLIDGYQQESEVCHD